MPPELAAVVAAAERFDDAAVPADLGPGAALGVAGPARRAVARSLVVQLATWTGPADWRLVVVADDPAAWDWCRWLPHASTGDAASVGGRPTTPTPVARRARRLDDGDRRHVVVVTDRPDLLAQRTGPLRRFLGAAPSVAVVAVVGPDGDAVPAMCRSVLEIGSLGVGPLVAGRVRRPPGRRRPRGRRHAVGDGGTSPAPLAGLHDPEDPSAAASALPPSVRLGALGEHHGAGPIDDAIAIAAAWRSAGAGPAARRPPSG